MSKSKDKFYRFIDRSEMQCLECNWTATRMNDAAPAVEHCNRESHQVQVRTTARIRPTTHRTKIEVEITGEAR